MFLSQYLRILWARKGLVLSLFVLVAAVGVAITLTMPRQYTAQASLVVDIRIDPALGALAPALAAPSYMQTQIEILRSERVASRAVKLLGVDRSATAVAQWRDATKAKIPLERYFADVLTRALSVEPPRGSNIINLYFSAPDPIFAQAGGLSARGTERGIKVHRKDATGAIKIFELKMNDPVERDDVIYVKESLF